MPRIHETTRIRPEVAEGDIHGIVSLFSLLSDETDAFEKDPERVLAATYPSEALTRLLHRMQVSLWQEDADRKGVFIVSGGYGSGKSHVLLALYHILHSPSPAASWLAQHEVDFTPPEDAVVVLMPMNQLSMPGKSGVDYLWEPIFHALGYEGFAHTGNNYPNDGHIAEAASGRRVILIVDELERWFMAKKDEPQREANIGFLQNLLEFCQDADRGVITLMTLLMIDPRIVTQADRVDAFREELTQAPDRKQIVLHRLVESVDAAAAEAVVDAYIAQYQQVDSHVGIGDYNAYRQQMLACYPFHPATIETVFRRYSSVASREVTNYQNSRGALYLLAHALRAAIPAGDGDAGALADADLIRPGDICLTVQQLYTDLQSLDPALVNLARENITASASVEHAAPVLSVVLLHSLGYQEAQRQVGAEFGDLLLGVVRPPAAPAGAVTPNEVQACLTRLQATAMNLHAEENPPRWLLKAEVNIDVQINRRARTEPVKKEAPQRIVAAIHEVLGPGAAVYPQEDIPDGRDITIVVSTEYLEPQVVLDQIYKGCQHPNGLVIISPRSPGSLMDDNDLMWLAQTRIAAEQIRKHMMGIAAEVPRRLRERAESPDLVRAIPDRYGKWLIPFVDASTGELGFRRQDVKLDRAAIMREIEARYAASHFEQSVMDAVRRRDETPPTVDQVREDFYRQRSYPKPVSGGKASDRPIDEAIARLVRTGQLEIVRRGDAHYICGKDPGVLQSDWIVAVPPEEHKPVFDPREAVLSYLRGKSATGATVADLRYHCREQASQLPGGPLEDITVDDAIVHLLAAHQLEAPSAQSLPEAPLPDTLLVRIRQEKTGGLTKTTTVTLGPMSLQKAKTTVIQEIGKTDRLSEVAVELVQQVSGKKLTEHFAGVLGLGSTKVGEGTALKVTYQLTGAQVTNRDQLVELLDGLPSEGDAKVEVSLKKEATPDGSEAQ